MANKIHGILVVCCQFGATVACPGAPTAEGNWSFELSLSFWFGRFGLAFMVVVRIIAWFVGRFCLMQLGTLLHFFLQKSIAKKIAKKVLQKNSWGGTPPPISKKKLASEPG